MFDNHRKKDKNVIRMKRCWLSFLMFLVVFGCGLMIRVAGVLADNPLIMISEFVPQPNEGEEEWIELLNPNQDTALDLTGYRLVIYQGPENNYTYRYEQDLSGSLPRGGFLTFTVGNGTTIPNEGACMVIFRDDMNSVYALKYGTGSCDDGADGQDATGVVIEQGNSIYYNLDEQTWNSATTTTRGWCNPGSGVCPTVATIVNQMASEGVTTNLDDQTDFSRVSGLYFQRSDSGQNIGKITFLAEMNFTDRDAMTWMQDLDSKLSISQGIISLDADLIKNLINTQASLIMYNISLVNPKILVDGADDSGNVVSGLTYDRTAGTLTFTAAHFTTFTAVENSGTTVTNSSSTSSGPERCGDWKPMSIPNLFQIDTSTDSAVLYFTPVTDHLTYYYVAFGHKQGDWQYGGQFNSSQKIGVVSIPINYLSPNTTYYFQVRGGNGCATGDWSNSLMAKTDGLTVSQTKVESVPVEEKVVERIPTPTPIRQEVQEVRETVEKEEVVENVVSDSENETVWQKMGNFFKSIF